MEPTRQGPFSICSVLCRIHLLWREGL